MNDALFEQLLYEEESPTLDFKKEQYRFVRASDDEKSELLKDVLGFANAWRRSEGYILIGVEDVRGGRSNVVGIPDHLDDHALQQFVNNLTNRPVLFHYEAFGFEGKQVGIITIEDQPRPTYLKRDYGKLQRNQVYVRRGSSTDPTKPATPDEIAQMGRHREAEFAELLVEFAAIDRDDSLGTQIALDAEYCKMPPAKSIPDFGMARDRDLILTAFGGTNRHFYREVADHVSAQRLFRPVRLVIRNAGKVAAQSVRAELTAAASVGVRIVDPARLPERPKRTADILTQVPALDLVQPAFGSPGDVTIDENADRVRVAMECGNLQPGRRVWSDLFYIGIRATGGVLLAGQIFADNLPHPRDFSLTIAANVNHITLSIAELKALSDEFN